MARRTSAPLVKSVSDDDVRALLQRYGCAVPFHEVRTRFLGSIASPAISVSPIRVVEGLWDGELPTFDSLDDANALIEALVSGLWNRLTRHQQRSAPFRLTRIDVAPTREGLSALAVMRREELDGFVDGLFGDNEDLDFPERAHRGLDRLAGMRALFAGVLTVTGDDTIPGTETDMQTTLQHLRALTKNAEHEIHEIVLSCTRARRQTLPGSPARKSTLH